MPLTASGLSGKMTIRRGEPTSDPFVSAQDAPPREATPLVETSQSWPPVWKARPELECVSAAKFVGPQADVATFRRRYGVIRDPVDAVTAGRVARAPLRLAGHWVQVKLAGRGSATVLWAGRITDEQDVPHGTTTPLTVAPGGTQTYTAYGALRVLERINFSKSWWIDTTIKELGWLPGFNSQSKGPTTAGVQRGNRSTSLQSVPGRGGWLSYLFGGDELWDMHAALVYVLTQFVNPQLLGATDPFLLVSGQIAALRQIKDFVPMRGASENAADLLMRLIPQKYGLSFKFVERVAVDAAGSEDFVGYDLQVVSQCPVAVNLGTVSVPTEIVTRLPILESQEYDVVIERSVAQKYRTVRAVGERVVSCFSAGPNSNDGTALEKGWTALAETAYLAATDQVRLDDVFRDVYQTFKVHSSWNFQNGAANPLIPPLTGAGNTRPVFSGGAAACPAYQLRVRSTLDRLPLKEQYDYTVDPPKLKATAGVTADPYEIDFMPPGLFALVSAAIGGQAATPLRWPVDTLSGAPGFEQCAASVEALERTLGLRIRSVPNHAYALGQSAVPNSEFTPDATNAVNWQQLDMTIACELDQRIAVEVTPSSSSPADIVSDGGVLEIEVPDAQFWWLAPGTIVGVSGASYLRAPAAGIVLRDDRYKLLFATAGALARHQRDRYAAQITVRQAGMYHALLGWFVSTTYRKADTLLDKVQITSVMWDFERLTTTLGLG